MSGIEDVDVLLASMKPTLSDEEFVFCTVPAIEASRYSSLEPRGTFREVEGTTLIVHKAQADRVGLTYDGVFSMISLAVHSSLSAVGLTAAVAKALADQAISANIVAAYFHDHVFVSAARALDAMNALQQLSANTGKNTI